MPLKMGVLWPRMPDSASTVSSVGPNSRIGTRFEKRANNCIGSPSIVAFMATCYGNVTIVTIGHIQSPGSPPFGAVFRHLVSGLARGLR